jgi:Spy/CpxP family protein refolding chaperone
MKHSRTLLFASAAALFALAAAQAPADGPVLLANDKVAYEWQRGWGKLPEGMSFGNTHGCVVVDSKG